MTDISRLRSRVSQAQERLTATTEQRTGLAERTEEAKQSLLNLEQAFARNRGQLESCRTELGQTRGENQQLRSLLELLLDTIEKSDEDPMKDILTDLDDITSNLSEFIMGGENGSDQDSSAQEPVNLTSLSDLLRKSRSNSEPRRPDNGTKRSAATRDAAADSKMRNSDETAVSAKRETESLETDELSLRAIADLWSKETGQSKILVRAELVEVFRDHFGKEVGEVTGDTTLTRENLLKFCAETNTPPPRFWA